MVTGSNDDSNTKGFVFVEEPGDPTIRKSALARRKVRSQAKLHAGQSKRGHMQVWAPTRDSGEFCVDRRISDGSQDDEGSNTIYTVTDPALYCNSLPMSPRTTGYYRTRNKYDFDIADLSSLVGIHVGSSGDRLPRLKPWAQNQLSSPRTASYLVFLPQLYEQSLLIRSAVDCVLAQSRRAFTDSTRTTESEVVLLYSKALGLLREALSDETKAVSDTTLLATALLLVFNLMDSSGLEHWRIHLGGLQRTLQSRLGSRSLTPTARAVMKDHIGLMLSNAFAQQQSSFLERIPWAKMVVNSSDATEALISNLLQRLCGAPGLLHDTKEIFDRPFYDAVAHGEVLQKMKQAAAHSLKWYHQFEIVQAELLAPTGPVKSPLRQCLHKYLEAARAIDIIINRCIVSLDVGNSETRFYELHTMQQAQKIQEMQETDGSTSPPDEEFCTTFCSLAHIAVATHTEWSLTIEAFALNESISRSSPQCIDRKVFDGWADLISMKGITYQSNLHRAEPCSECAKQSSPE